MVSFIEQTSTKSHQTPNTINMKSFLAAILSLIVPGLGQLYAGNFISAIIWFICIAVLDYILGWTIIVPIIMHLACAVTAYIQKAKQVDN